MKIHQIKCPSCNAKLDIEEKRESFFCSYCGSKLYLDDGTVKIEITENINIKDEARIKENETHEKIKMKELELDEKKDKRKQLGEYLPIVIYLGVMFIFIILCFGMSLFSPNGKFSSKITIPNDNKYYEGENYKEVIQELEDAGFDNVTTKKIEDLVTGWITKDGEVEKVSINGETKFKKDDVFKKDSKVVVSYHTFEEKKKK